ncbi:hypothetical protein DFH94DRAFT_846339 [Russula ochroleuca]|uniref:Uncharacterized protein n=1 Tax=Russula ochroleuca TaxID=152965 RepID=A0A9P5T671_9AGAM|nr:hypothetical protein DFH94DRAFT_846339 [Russula ochroleuca]
MDRVHFRDLDLDDKKFVSTVRPTTSSFTNPGWCIISLRTPTTRCQHPAQSPLTVIALPELAHALQFNDKSDYSYLRKLFRDLSPVRVIRMTTCSTGVSSTASSMRCQVPVLRQRAVEVKVVHDDESEPRTSDRQLRSLTRQMQFTTWLLSRVGLYSTIGSPEGAQNSVATSNAAVNRSTPDIVLLCSVKMPCTLRGDTVPEMRNAKRLMNRDVKHPHLDEL